MHQPALPRLGAACGAIFAIVLNIAAGDGVKALEDIYFWLKAKN